MRLQQRSTAIVVIVFVLLEVRHLASDEVVVVRRWIGEAWRMVEPFGAEADYTRVEGLLGRLSTLQSTRVIDEEDADLEAFGLSEPLMRVRVDLESGDSQVLLVGRENPAGYSQYVQREGGEAVYLVSSSAIKDLERLLDEPPEKPNPMPTETLVPKVITSAPTVSAGGTATVEPTPTVQE
jgi:hypothetical protein